MTLTTAPHTHRIPCATASYPTPQALVLYRDLGGDKGVRRELVRDVQRVAMEWGGSEWDGSEWDGVGSGGVDLAGLWCR